MSLWTELAPAEFGIVDIAGIPTRLLQFGDPGATPLVALHGRGGHLETFAHNIRAMAAEGYRVIAFDLLGHGLTAHRGTTYDIGELTAHAEAVRERYAPGEHVLVGQSIGGWAAMLLAQARAPQHLVLVEPAGLQSEAERMADPVVAAATVRGGKAFEEATDENVRLRFGELLLDPAAIDPEMVAVRLAFYRLPGASAVHLAVRHADNRAWLQTAESLRAAGLAPLLVRGDHGHIPAALFEQVAAVTGGEVVTIPQAQQWPHFENPSAWNAAFGRFVRKGSL
jgi:pimeloyl-ACP methyl ester carboxylesterase